MPARSGRRRWCALVAGMALLSACREQGAVPPALAQGNAATRPLTEAAQQAATAFDGQQAYAHLVRICEFGPRISDSPGMHKQQEYAAEHFHRHGAEVRRQRFRVRHPRDGSPVTMANLIARWRPQLAARILLCAHYDTRPFPDRDRENPRGVFLGANDGASGVAVLLELARQLEHLATPWGIDCVLFDGEEFVFSEDDTYFLGSEYFARRIIQERPRWHYRWGLLLDMVGDADLLLPQEGNSRGWSDTRPLIDTLWQTAGRLGFREFVAEERFAVRDDHLPLHDIAGIPVCDIIDFEYPYWHTQADTPDKCSAASLARVGQVVAAWLAELSPPPHGPPARALGNP